MTVSVTTATVGVPFAVNLSGPAGNASFTLEIPGVDDDAIEVAGAQTAVTTDGAASFSVTLPEEGTYTLTGTDAEGQVVGSASVTAVAAGSDGGGVGSVTDDGTVGVSAEDGSDGGILAVTGASSAPYLLAAAGLLVAGLVALLAARARSRRAARSEPGRSGSSL
ncbi:peptidase [Isoptericola cucumis]|nr:peptidase [Isoptericola cucumis]